MNKTLDDMLVMVTEENIHSEIDIGFPVGKEEILPYSMNDDKLEKANMEI